MKESQLCELEAICERATRPEWFARGRHLSLVADNSGMGATLHTNHIGNFAEPDDATFIATARTALPEAIAEVRRLKAALMEACDIAERRRAAIDYLGRNIDGYETTKEAADQIEHGLIDIDGMYETGVTDARDTVTRIASLRKECSDE